MHRISKGLSAALSVLIVMVGLVSQVSATGCPGQFALRTGMQAALHNMRLERKTELLADRTRQFQCLIESPFTQSYGM